VVGQRHGMGGKQEKMLALWLRINKSPKAKQVNNIHRIATAHCQRRRCRLPAVILSFTLTEFDKTCNAPTFDFYSFIYFWFILQSCQYLRRHKVKRLDGVNNETEGIWKETVLSRRLPGQNGVHHEKCQL
jgi:hypothetical protein